MLNAARAERVENVEAFSRPIATYRRSVVDDRDHWRERARRAEEALRGDSWHKRLHPFTLYESRIVRVLARHETVSVEMLMVALYAGHSNAEPDAKSIRTLICRIRRKIPARFIITPIFGYGWYVSRRSDFQSYLARLKTAPDRNGKTARS